MSHSHLPQWKAAKAKGNTFDKGNYQSGGVSSRQVSTRDLPSFTKLKYRQTGSFVPNEIIQEEEENDMLRNTTDSNTHELIQEDKNKDNEDVNAVQRDDDEKPLQNDELTKPLTTLENDKELEQFDDEDDQVSSDSEDSNDSESNSSDDDDDSSEDEAEIARELEKIRREREEAAKEKAQDEQILQKQAESASQSTKVKRRWDADVVFRNQAKNEPEVKKRFINDTIRSDLHRNFLKKYVQ